MKRTRSCLAGHAEGRSLGGRRGWVRVGALCAGVLCGSTAGADEIDSLGGRIVELDAKVSDLNLQLRPIPKPGPEIADRRLIDAQVLYELRNYEAASVILFDLVEKYPSSAAYPEGLYYLADSLYLKRDFLSSRRFFEKIVEVGAQGPRYQEALQRLIELSLHTGDYAPVDGYITKLEGLPPGRQLPSVPYVKGKYFYFRGQPDRALEALRAIGVDHVYYFHAQYFVAAANVALGGDHLEAAQQAFTAILKAPAKTDAHKRIAELANLGMARIFLDRGQLSASLTAYAKIGTKSEYFNEALYESAWVSVKGKEYAQATRQLDLLLLNAPDSLLAPEVKLLSGGLQIRQGRFGPATESFTKTRDEYEPLRKQLEEEVARSGQSSAFFRDLVQKNLSKFDVAQLVPAVAARWVKGEPAVERLSSLVGDVGDLGKSLDESEEILRRLDKAVSGPARVNVFPELAAARAKAVALSAELSESKKQLTDREARLIGSVAGPEQQLFTQLEVQRAELERKLKQLPTSTESIEARQKKAREQFNELDKRASEAQAELNGVRASTVATRKFYQDQVAQQLAPQQREAAEQELEAWMQEVEARQLEVETLRRELDDAAGSVGVDDADMQLAEQLRRDYDEVGRKLHDMGVAVRARLSAADRTKAEQIQSILDRSRAVERKLAAFNERIEGLLDARLKEIRESMEEERARVASYREILTGYGGESAEVGGEVLADRVKAVADRFYNIVVRSDVGIIDVAWALKDASTRETNRLVAERKRELKLIDDEFKEVLKEQP